MNRPNLIRHRSLLLFISTVCFFRLSSLGLFLILVATGCSTTPTVEDRYRASLESYQRTISQVVSDEDRAERLREIGDQLFRDLLRCTEELNKLVERIEVLNRDYDASREDLETALSDLDRQRQRLMEHLSRARAEAVAVTTSEEWEILVSREASILSLFREDLDQRQKSR